MVLPCPICGKGMNMLTKARTFPEHGTARRRDFCIALGVPHNTFDHIRTRRKMCFSHFDEEEFYIGRHILKHCAMPRELTEREKFILFNSDFNKARFRRRKQPQNDTEKDTPSSSKSNCYGTFETSNKDGVTKVRFKKKKIQKVPAPRVSCQTVPVSNTNVSNAPSVTILNGDGIRIAEGPTPNW
uniref:THAP-type domain-containing protein n=1 Tax=Panagrolaimus superbus TaxID=310955 RepID=A0A914Y049_9BILA